MAALTLKLVFNPISGNFDYVAVPSVSAAFVFFMSA